MNIQERCAHWLELARSVQQKARRIKTVSFFCILILISLFGWRYFETIDMDDIRYLQSSVRNLHLQLENLKIADIDSIKEVRTQLSKIQWNPIKIEAIEKASKKARETIQILENYWDDKTGRPDFALESSGGRIWSIGDTLLLEPHSWNPFNKQRFTPELAIRPSMHHGQCFCFKGSQGSLLIKLAWIGMLDSIALEHISPKLTPKGKVTDAPKDFSVWVRILLAYRQQLSSSYGVCQ